MLSSHPEIITIESQARECVDETAVAAWEELCGHRLPEPYRSWLKIAGGSSHSVTGPFFLSPDSSGAEPVQSWLLPEGADDFEPYVEGAAHGLRAVEWATSELRYDMTHETFGLANAWAPWIVPFAEMASSRRWWCFDFAYDAEQPPVIAYDQQTSWEDTFPETIIEFAAPDFAAFMAGMQVVTTLEELKELGNDPRASTEDSLRWREHRKQQLGGLKGWDLTDEIARRERQRRIDGGFPVEEWISPSQKHADQKREYEASRARYRVDLPLPGKESAD